jgi:hypothetical protein
MLFIHKSTCISPQHTFSNTDIELLMDVTDHKLKAIEPSYEGIPPGTLRRMGKAVRMGVGSALPLLRDRPDGIIIGTANGGMEDCIKFLNQIIDYAEGMLAPGNFVQSTANAIAAQLGMISGNKGYNITHVHRGLAFENALLDAVLLLNENPSHQYLLGAVDEISAYNYNIELLGGWYKQDVISNRNLYTSDTAASIAGEGAAMFLVNKTASGAMAKLEGICFFHTQAQKEFSDRLRQFLKDHLQVTGEIDLLLSGENGDNRLQGYYTACEELLGESISIARFKHMTGEYPTASGPAVWLACLILQGQSMPRHMVKRQGDKKKIKKILVYNNYKGLQHSFILLSGGS